MGNKCPKCQADNPDSQKFCGECGTSLPFENPAEAVGPTRTMETPLEALITGATFAGRYQIIEELGKGGMGKVYRVLDQKLDEQVALKVIKPEIASDKKTIERFKNELKLARKISHRNVGRMYELLEERGIHFITMEYVPGGDLRRFIRRSKQLNIGTAISIAKQICEGLAEAHGHGVVHRDLKPSNILIDDNGNARILDFGIARSVKEKGITGSGIMIGTPEYMSPEQVEAKDVDQRADLYSLGIILYEMTTGRLPFEADTPFAVGVKQKGEEPEDPRTFNPQIPEDLSRVILKCLEKEKEDRYPSADKVRTELEKIEKGLPVTAKAVPSKKPVTSREITVSFSPKKILAPALIFVVCVTVGIGIWQIFFKKDPSSGWTEKPKIAVLPFEDLSLEKDQAPICELMLIDINSKLNRLQIMEVKSRFVVKSFGGEGKNPLDVGRELGVDIILAGTIQSDRENIRMDPDLIDVRDGTTLWSEPIVYKSDEIFSLQDEIVERITESLGLTLSSNEKAQIRRKPTANPEAYRLYAWGRSFYDKRADEDYEKAIGYYRQAIALDPDYALAWSGLADVYMSQAVNGMDTAEKAREAAKKALELDDTLAEAYASQAIIKLSVDWDFKGAEIDFKKAIDLDPNYATAHHWYGILLTRLGRHDQAKEEIERALELNPADLSINRNYAWTLLSGHHYYEAIDQARMTYDRNPDFLLSKKTLALTYAAKSMYQEILELYEYDEESNFVKLVHILNLAKDNRDEAVKIFDGLASTVPDLDAAFVYAQLGEDDKVFVHLERAYENRNPDMQNVKAAFAFEKYHSNPRFQALLKKMGLD